MIPLSAKGGPVVSEPRLLEDAGEGPGYETPELVALGNLHDLLAGDGGTQCDNVSGETTTGHDGTAC